MKRIAIFASGAGSNAAKIIEYFSTRNTIEVAVIVCNKPDAGVLKIAADHDIPTILIGKETFFRGDAYVAELKSLNIDFIVLAGFLWKIPQQLIAAYPNKMINIHPALLPNYGGKGMYGSHVHEAVVAAGEKETGITIHWVDAHYDEGDIILQKKCSIDATDTPTTVAQKIHVLEHQYFAPTIEELLK